MCVPDDNVYQATLFPPRVSLLVADAVAVKVLTPFHTTMSNY